MGDQLYPDPKMPRRTAAERRLADLVADVRGCRKCRDAPEQKHQLPVEPNPVLRVRTSARLAVCGQAPGTLVHKSGAPFTDPSGERLRDWMGVGPDVFYDPAQIAIVPMGFCFPGQDTKGGDLPPRRECAPLWRQRIFDELGQLELVLLVGAYAQKWHLGSAAEPTLSRTVARWQEYFDRDPADSGPRYLPLPHPSWRNNGWIRKNPWFTDQVLPRLRLEVAKLVRSTIS